MGSAPSEPALVTSTQQNSRLAAGEGGQTRSTRESGSPRPQNRSSAGDTGAARAGGGNRAATGASRGGGGGRQGNSDDIVFETFFHKNGKSYCCIFTNGCRFYLDSFKTGEWKEFPWEWYSDGTLVTDEVQDNQQVDKLPTSEAGEVRVSVKQQSDDREGVMKIPNKGVYQTYVFEQRRNVHCYYDSEEGSWVKIPIRWELTTPLAKGLVKRVQKTLTQWHDEVDILASLRVSNYNVDDCVNTYLATVGNVPAQLTREKSVIAQSDSMDSLEKKLKVAESRIKELEASLKQEREEKQDLQKKYEHVNEEMASTRAECQAAIAQVNALKESRPKTAASKRPGMETVPRESLNQIAKEAKAIAKAQLQLKSEVDELKKKFLAEIAKAVEVAKKIKTCEKSSSSEIDELRTLYRREALQRKLLYNQLQELRGNIRVFARCRNDPSVDVALTFPGDQEVQVPTGNSKKTFSFDHVFDPKCSQEKVFGEVLPIVTSCVDGYHVCILAYGQTGSGKTYTMQGPPDNPGVNVRAIRELLKICSDRKETVDYTLKLSMVEIYNETVQDLLSATVKSVEIRSQGNKISLQGLTEMAVQTEPDIAKIMDTGAANRKVASTKMNSQSSRSHLLVILSVCGKDKVSGTMSRGQLTMCDLAGSERVSKTEAEGARLTEAAFINKSLTSLGQVFTALRTNQLHIPYRNSKLTHILQPSLGGDAKAALFVNVRSDASNTQETTSTLQFGSNARQVALGQAKANVKK